MEILNPFNNDNISDILKGKWGKDVGNDYKLFYLQNIIIGVGELEILKKKSSGNVSEWIELTNNVYLGIMR